MKESVSRCVSAGSADGAPAKRLWQLHEAVELMRAAYCGTLALEYMHLQQQSEISWMSSRFESRASLQPRERRQVGVHPHAMLNTCTNTVHVRGAINPCALHYCGAR
jgi:hypothetical protein